MARLSHVIVGVAGLAYWAASAHAQDHDLKVAGGALDSAFVGSADVFTSTPMPAEAHGRACAVAQRYVDLLNTGQFQRISDLFEVDGIVMEPMRSIDRGRAQIHAFYDQRMRKTPPQLIAVALVGDDTDCMLEIAAKRLIRGEQRYTLVSVDHFTLAKSGKVIRMVAFSRPPRTN